MSTFNRFCAKVRRTVIRVGDKVEEMGDSAALSVKMKGLQIRIDEQYEKLGEIVYRDLHTEADLEEEKLAVIAAIDALFDELEELKSKKEQKASAAAEEETEQTEKTEEGEDETAEACSEEE